MKKNVFSFLMILTLMLCLFPGAASAESAVPAAGDTLYLGEYEEQPLAWQILDSKAMNTGDPGLFFISSTVLDNGGVTYDGGVASWQGSSAQTWCAEFLERAFSPLEQAAIPAVDKKEEAFQGFGLSWGEVTLEREKVFFLSTQEIVDYIAADDGMPGISAATADGEEASWWLRTPHGFHSDYAGLVMGNDQVHDFLVYGGWGARPAANLSAETCLLLTAADEEAVIGALAPIAAPADGTWKATLPDESLAFALSGVERSGDELQIFYTGTVPGGYLSALVREADGAVSAYARLAQTKKESGMLSLPEEQLTVPEGAQLLLFAEQENGPRRSNAASSPVVLTLPEPEAETETDTAEPEAGSAEPEPVQETAAPAVADRAEILRTAFTLFFRTFGLYIAAVAALLALVLILIAGIKRRRR